MLGKLSNKKNWKNIHKDFTEKIFGGENHQQKWEEYGFTYQAIKEWIDIGLKTSEYDFAYYLKNEDYKPTTITNIPELRNEFSKHIKKAQNYIDIYYLPKKRELIKKMDISKKELKDDLNLTDFTSLKELDCNHNDLISLNISNCQKLTRLDCSCNKLTDRTLIFPEKIEKLISLQLSHNQLTKLSIFSKFVNLEELWISNNSFHGSLEALNDCKKLKKLDIRDTKIDHGLEYLHDSLEIFLCEETNVKKELDKNNRRYENLDNISLLKRWKTTKIPSQAEKTETSTLLPIKEKDSSDLGSYLLKNGVSINNYVTQSSFGDNTTVVANTNISQNYQQKGEEFLYNRQMITVKQKELRELKERTRNGQVELIDEVCEKQREIDELEIGQTFFKNREEKTLTIIGNTNYSGNLTSQGNMVNGEMNVGSNSNFSTKHNQLTVTKLENQVEVPPK